MPFELHTIQDRSRLVITEPVTQRTQVDITLDDERTITAAYKGGRIDGALLVSPLIGSLTQNERKVINAHENALRLLFSSKMKELQSCNETLEELKGANDQASIELISGYMKLQTVKRTALNEISRLQNIPPLLSAVTIGEPLKMLLPSTIDDWEVHELGVVTKICLSK